MKPKEEIEEKKPQVINEKKEESPHMPKPVAKREEFNDDKLKENSMLNLNYRSNTCA